MDEQLIKWRKALHQRPEISGAEVETAAKITSILQSMNPDQIITGIGGHGVLAVFHGDQPQQNVLLRCELDGLPIEETNSFSYKSEIFGKGHLCGHDGHMAIMLGLAQHFSNNRPENINLGILFQPAEETGKGAIAVINDDVGGFVPDVAVALHNAPGLPIGHIYTKLGPMCCASRGLRVVLKGRTAHASQPETGISPVETINKILPQIQDLNDTNYETIPNRMATITHVNIGEKTFGVAPADAEIWVTLRTQLDVDMADLCKLAETIIDTECAKNQIAYTCEYDDVFDATINDETIVKLIQDAAKNANIPFEKLDAPMRWSEDFGQFAKQSQSALFLLGAGEDCPALHSPDYDFPDALIPIGVQAFVEIVSRIDKQVMF